MAFSTAKRDGAEIIDLLARTPAYKQQLAEQAAALALTRSHQIAALRRLEKEQEASYPKRTAAVETELAAVKRAELALHAAQLKWQAAETAKSQASAVYSGQRGRIEAELRASASPALDQFRSEMLDELDASRKQFQFNATMAKHPITGAATRVCINNADSVASRVCAIQFAMEAAEDLRLYAPDQATIPAELEKLRQSLPPIDQVLR
jgi:hypothetical protein